VAFEKGTSRPFSGHRSTDGFNDIEEMLVRRREVERGWLGVLVLRLIHSDARSERRGICDSFGFTFGPILDANGKELRKHERRRFEIGHGFDAALLFLLILQPPSRLPFGAGGVVSDDRSKVLVEAFDEWTARSV
jgi:hypothetical protein